MLECCFRVHLFRFAWKATKLQSHSFWRRFCQGNDGHGNGKMRRNRQRNVRQRNNSRHGLFPIPLPNIPLPVIPLSSRPSPVSSLFICGSNSFFEVQLLRHSASNRDGAEGSGPQRARRPILPHGASSRRDGRCGAGKGRVSERVSGGQAKIYSRPFPLDAHQCQRFASARTFRKSLARTI